MDTVIDGIDYGPLAALLGSWKGDKGVDLASEPDGPVESPYYETLTFAPAGDVDNANKQDLVIVTYHQEVFRKSNDEKFHDQLGYWVWEQAANWVAHMFVIPRAVGIVAEGPFTGPKDDGSITFEVSTANNQGVAESTFMRDNARTTMFSMLLTVKGDQLSYKQSTMLDIYGNEFDHTDVSELSRVR